MIHTYYFQDYSGNRYQVQQPPDTSLCKLAQHLPGSSPHIVTPKVQPLLATLSSDLRGDLYGFRHGPSGKLYMLYAIKNEA